jgi:hypothetical protein
VVARSGGNRRGLGDADAGGFWKGIVRAGGGRKWYLRLVGSFADDCVLSPGLWETGLVESDGMYVCNVAERPRCRENTEMPAACCGFSMPRQVGLRGGGKWKGKGRW